MGKQRKKLRCICKGKALRVYPGIDHQKHTEKCPLTTGNRRDGEY
ncbi:hypothetical protein SEA_MORRIGAN_55 [Microbacterium phage Morrigan]|nr:hypothetical protein SEA_MORRIGAN_55 [Microbacterium phage Morrigan]